jgi:hypothetical protein
MTEKVVLNVPENGTVTLLFTALRFVLALSEFGFPGSINRTIPEPLLPAGQAVLEV